MLKGCPNLEELRVYVKGERWAPEDMAARPPLDRAISLPSLRILGIHSSRNIDSLFNQMYFPILAELYLMHMQAEDDRPMYVPASALLGFMESQEYSFPSIHKLDICVQHYLHTDIVRSLERLPNIRHLVFNRLGERCGSSWYDDHTTGRFAGRGFREYMVVRLTPTISSPTPVVPTENPSVDCLCPLLERVDFLERSTYETNPHLNLRTIVPFVAAKWQFSQSHPDTVSLLKHLTLPTKDLPKKRAKHALKEWIERTGLVLEIAYPYLRTARPSALYEGPFPEEE